MAIYWYFQDTNQHSFLITFLLLNNYLVYRVMWTPWSTLRNCITNGYSPYWWSAYIEVSIGVGSSYLNFNKDDQNYCRRVSKSQPPSKNAHWLLWISAIYSAYNWRMICQKRNDTLVKKIKKINHSTKNKCNKSAPKRRKLPLNRWILNAQLPFVLIIIFFV